MDKPGRLNSPAATKKAWRVRQFPRSYSYTGIPDFGTGYPNKDTCVPENILMKALSEFTILRHVFYQLILTHLSFISMNSSISDVLHFRFFSAAFSLLLIPVIFISCSEPEEEWQSLFNGENFSGWVVPESDNGHWQVIDGVIDYDALSEAAEEKSLWSEYEYGDFVLRLEWRIKETPYVNENVPIVLPNGSHKLNENGEVIRMAVPDSDSGIYLRGSSKAQVNIWGWPVGSGEVYGYRTDERMSEEVRAGVTPKLHADRNIGEWNTFEITMIGDLLTVELNGHIVIEDAQLPGVSERGAIALQHHGSQTNGEWTSPPSLVQFRNISIREL